MPTDAPKEKAEDNAPKRSLLENFKAAVADKSALQARIETLEEEAGGYLAENESLKTELAKLKGEHAKASEELATAQGEIETLKAEAETAEKAAATIVAEKVGVKTEELPSAAAKGEVLTVEDALEKVNAGVTPLERGLAWQEQKKALFGRN